MLRRKNQLSVDENIWEALFVFEKIEARGAASTGPAFGNEESTCLTWELRASVWDLMWSGMMDDTVSQGLSSTNTLSDSPAWTALLVRKWMKMETLGLQNSQKNPLKCCWNWIIMQNMPPLMKLYRKYCIFCRKDLELDRDLVELEKLLQWDTMSK